jgi:hypothetical protein
VSESHGTPKPRPPIRTVKRGLSRRLLHNPGVSGVGIDEDEKGKERIRVYVIDDSPQLRSLVPDMVDGYPVVIETVGHIRPRQQSG